ncbi:MAG: FAD:protein FMN transferase [Clostridia bacterium]|nr:FAD:protein FMN transferase [Clostridia bacterium]
MVKKSKNLLIISAVVLVVVIFTVSLFSSMTNDAEASNFAMGSPVDIKVYGEKDGDALCGYAIERIKFIDNVYLSHTISSSAVSTLNRDGKLTADKWLGDYLTECVELSAKSDSFTLFSGDMKDLWQIENGGYVPTDSEIADLLQKLENTELIINSNEMTLQNGKIDLGALGKGTACGEAIDYLKKQNVEKALVTVGGSIGAIGDESFSIGVRNPFGGQNDYFAILNATNCFVSTSGDYEKFFERDGIRYSHIFDATTGKPVQNDITSVTVVAESGTVSDFLSTAIFAEGIENGIKLADEFGAEVIIVKKDKSVLVSKGLENKLTINDNSFSISVIE